MLGFTKRTCHFILDARKRRSLYLSLVRSNFEHGSIIWRPVTETEISDFEKLQKKALKWIFKEENMHYNDETYIKKCCQVNLTPMKIFFDINDLTFFHKIVYENVPIFLPETPLLYAVYVDGYVYSLYFLAQKKLAIAFFKNYRKF